MAILGFFLVLVDKRLLFGAQRTGDAYCDACTEDGSIGKKKNLTK
jgi:hypothetical protein